MNQPRKLDRSLQWRKEVVETPQIVTISSLASTITALIYLWLTGYFSR